MPPAKAKKMYHPRRLPPLFGYAAGTSQGEPATAAAALCRPPGTTMAALTGTPLAVALGMLCDGDITSPGVHPPEAIIDPGRFFAALAKYCPDHPDPAEMVSVVRSWDTDARARYQSDILAARRYASALPLNPITVRQDLLRSHSLRESDRRVEGAHELRPGQVSFFGQRVERLRLGQASAQSDDRDDDVASDDATLGPAGITVSVLQDSDRAKRRSGH